MLQNTVFANEISKKDYKEEKAKLQRKLKELHLKTIDLKIPINIMIEGLSSAGKGKIIGKILEPLDPKFFDVHTMNKVTESYYKRPYMYFYFTRTAERGHISIFDKTYYRIILEENRKKWKLSEKEIKTFYEDVNNFERLMVDDKSVLIKFFYQIDKNEQKKRLTELDSNETTKWRVDKEDWKENENYKDVVKQYSKVLENTNKIEQWNVISSNNGDYAEIETLKVIVSKMEQAIEEKEKGIDQKFNYKPNTENVLKNIDLNKTIEKDEYKEKLKSLQNEVSNLMSKLYQEKKSVVIVYEGWDASGKGGNIKRLTREMDPRAYKVVPISAPTKKELNQHYLWRFWNEVPKKGYTTIFDRSWYGRVMVERVEGFCTKTQWQQAYNEINEFEKSLYNHNAVIYKFFIHINKEEQLKRFKAREIDPLKAYKITEEDWRNREKWELYEECVNEMIVKTNTDYAPWVIVEGNDKKYARIKVLSHIVKDLKKQLGK